MSYPKTPNWMIKYFDEHAEICPGCQREVTVSNQFHRAGQTWEGGTDRFHVCQEKHLQPITFKLSNERPKLSFHVCSVKDCDSAKPVGTEVWQKQGKAALQRYYPNHSLVEARCSYHQPVPS